MLVVGEGGEDERVGEDSGSFFVRRGEWLELVSFGSLGTIKLSESAVEIDAIFREESAVVGLLRPNDVVNKEIERGAEI